ncbi:hypothetical protein HYH03_003061 [Edaphochlamys debaryana]|uniref:Guanylate cyclase domain-containing protein n=1 Tax=Edaphochlamys debaryana TaxID=47281 RepID=A0A835YBW2_9CHLO|nr:hypothetical protein HYH03_003061 [Edaphochlamys debaryana]|eukprot:KAG2498869.1 hypothetical protein HYH03_003061 [Edaphochlamys debaryana]
MLVANFAAALSALFLGGGPVPLRLGALMKALRRPHDVPFLKPSEPAPAASGAAGSPTLPASVAAETAAVSGKEVAGPAVSLSWLLQAELVVRLAWPLLAATLEPAELHGPMSALAWYHVAIILALQSVTAGGSLGGGAAAFQLLAAALVRAAHLVAAGPAPPASALAAAGSLCWHLWDFGPFRLPEYWLGALVAFGMRAMLSLGATQHASHHDAASAGAAAAAVARHLAASGSLPTRAPGAATPVSVEMEPLSAAQEPVEGRSTPHAYSQPQPRKDSSTTRRQHLTDASQAPAMVTATVKATLAVLGASSASGAVAAEPHAMHKSRSTPAVEELPAARASVSRTADGASAYDSSAYAAGAPDALSPARPAERGALGRVRGVTRSTSFNLRAGIAAAGSQALAALTPLAAGAIAALRDSAVGPTSPTGPATGAGWTTSGPPTTSAAFNRFSATSVLSEQIEELLDIKRLTASSIGGGVGVGGGGGAAGALDIGGGGRGGSQRPCSGPQRVHNVRRRRGSNLSVDNGGIAYYTPLLGQGASRLAEARSPELRTAMSGTRTTASTASTDDDADIDGAPPVSRGPSQTSGCGRSPLGLGSPLRSGTTAPGAHSPAHGPAQASGSSPRSAQSLRRLSSMPSRLRSTAAAAAAPVVAAAPPQPLDAHVDTDVEDEPRRAAMEAAGSAQRRRNSPRAIAAVRMRMAGLSGRLADRLALSAGGAGSPSSSLLSGPPAANRSRAGSLGLLPALGAAPDAALAAAEAAAGEGGAQSATGLGLGLAVGLSLAGGGSGGGTPGAAVDQDLRKEALRQLVMARWRSSMVAAEMVEAAGGGTPGSGGSPLQPHASGGTAADEVAASAARSPPRPHARAPLLPAEVLGQADGAGLEAEDREAHPGATTTGDRSGSWSGLSRSTAAAAAALAAVAAAADELPPLHSPRGSDRVRSGSALGTTAMNTAPGTGANSAATGNSRKSLALTSRTTSIKTSNLSRNTSANARISISGTVDDATAGRDALTPAVLGSRAAAALGGWWRRQGAAMVEEGWRGEAGAVLAHALAASAPAGALASGLDRAKLLFAALAGRSGASGVAWASLAVSPYLLGAGHFAAATAADPDAYRRWGALLWAARMLASAPLQLLAVSALGLRPAASASQAAWSACYYLAAAGFSAPRYGTLVLICTTLMAAVSLVDEQLLQAVAAGGDGAGAAGIAVELLRRAAALLVVGTGGAAAGMLAARGLPHLAAGFLTSSWLRHRLPSARAARAARLAGTAAVESEAPSGAAMAYLALAYAPLLHAALALHSIGRAALVTLASDLGGGDLGGSSSRAGSSLAAHMAAYRSRLQTRWLPSLPPSVVGALAAARSLLPQGALAVAVAVGLLALLVLLAAAQALLMAALSGDGRRAARFHRRQAALMALKGRLLEAPSVLELLQALTAGADTLLEGCSAWCVIVPTAAPEGPGADYGVLVDVRQHPDLLPWPPRTPPETQASQPPAGQPRAEPSPHPHEPPHPHPPEQQRRSQDAGRSLRERHAEHAEGRWSLPGSVHAQDDELSTDQYEDATEDPIRQLDLELDTAETEGHDHDHDEETGSTASGSATFFGGSARASGSGAQGSGERAPSICLADHPSLQLAMVHRTIWVVQGRQAKVYGGTAALSDTLLLQQPAPPDLEALAAAVGAAGLLVLPLECLAQPYGVLVVACAQPSAADRHLRLLALGLADSLSQALYLKQMQAEVAASDMVMQDIYPSHAVQVVKRRFQGASSARFMPPMAVPPVATSVPPGGLLQGFAAHAHAGVGFGPGSAPGSATAMDRSQSSRFHSGILVSNSGTGLAAGPGSQGGGLVATNSVGVPSGGVASPVATQIYAQQAATAPGGHGGGSSSGGGFGFSLTGGFGGQAGGGHGSRDGSGNNSGSRVTPSASGRGLYAQMASALSSPPTCNTYGAALLGQQAAAMAAATAAAAARGGRFSADSGSVPGTPRSITVTRAASVAHAPGTARPSTDDLPLLGGGSTSGVGGPDGNGSGSFASAAAIFSPTAAALASALVPALRPVLTTAESGRVSSPMGGGGWTGLGSLGAAGPHATGSGDTPTTVGPPGGSTGGALGTGENFAPMLIDVPYARWHGAVSVLFADICGYTATSQALEPEQVMALLHTLFSKYDSLLSQYNVYKVETIGDCFMACTGLVVETPSHAVDLVRFGRAMIAAAAEVPNPVTGDRLQIRVGVNSGRVMSGIVGSVRGRYCLFGDTVNTASRLESTGVPGKVQISEITYAELPEEERSNWKCRGFVEAKGKGLVKTYLSA